VESIAYTSMVNADTTGIGLAAEHQATEELLAKTGVPVTLLRNAWYGENYTDNLAQTLQHRAVLRAAGDGRVAGATRPGFSPAARPLHRRRRRCRRRPSVSRAGHRVRLGGARDHVPAPGAAHRVAGDPERDAVRQRDRARRACISLSSPRAAGFLADMKAEGG